MNKNKPATEPGREDVAKKAYSLFLKDGRRQGQAVRNWLEAEAQIGHSASESHMPVPATTTAAASESAGKGIDASREYVCPMHPQIVRSEPGSCPICGMALDSRTTSADEAENPELKDMQRRFWTGVALTTPVLISAIGDIIPGQPLARALSPFQADQHRSGDRMSADASDSNAKQSFTPTPTRTNIMIGPRRAFSNKSDGQTSPHHCPVTTLSDAATKRMTEPQSGSRNHL